ncbi:isochorismatase family protein [Clostridiales bacterium oral taxon 876 str. F0540]|nr:isochorismatase family protein [Clostridiales bacterium oral taxon 876 str. F0540]
MSNVALLVVDVQNALIKAHPYNEQIVIENIKKLILEARNNNKEVIYVRHDDGKGTDLEKETDGWQIYDAIAPESNDAIFEKQYNSAFLKTGLKDYLDSKNIDNIILTGLQTEYCIDATCKSAFENGYKVIIPEQTNTTFDNEYLSADKLYEFYNYKIWNKRFAEILSIEETIKILKCR